MQILTAINVTFEALHASNVLFIAHNIYKYVIGLRMKRVQIWMFYGFLLFATSMRIVEFALRIIHPEQSYLYKTRSLYTFTTFGNLADVFAVCTLANVDLCHSSTVIEKRI